MSERYSNLFTLPENLYVEGSPIVLVAGVLLKNNYTNIVVVQLKMKNISDKTIKALKVSIHAFDVYGKELSDIDECQYLDLFVSRNAEFGQKNAIVLPDHNTRSITVSIVSVIFVDNSVWEMREYGAFKPIPKQSYLKDVLKSDELAEQYKRETVKSSEFLPIDYLDLWLCSCGAINHDGESSCYSCKMTVKLLNEKLNFEVLEKGKKLFDEEVAKQRVLLEQEERVRKRKTKRIAIISSSISFVVVVIALITQVVIPSYKYNSAVVLMENAQYDEAIIAFEDLGKYKDSTDKAEICKLDKAYFEADKLFASGDYRSAYELFSTLEDYKDSEDRRIEAKNVADNDETYKNAVYLFNNQDFQGAREKFQLVKDYKDSLEFIRQIDAPLVYEKAKKEETQSILSAYKSYKELPADYLDTSERIKLIEKYVGYTGNFNYSSDIDNDILLRINIYIENDTIYAKFEKINSRGFTLFGYGEITSTDKEGFDYEVKDVFRGKNNIYYLSNTLIIRNSQNDNSETDCKGYRVGEVPTLN